MIQFENKEQLDAYSKTVGYRFDKGEVCIVGDTHFVWNDEWQELKVSVDGDGLSMSLYELNAQIMSQIPNHNQEQLKTDINIINDFHKEVNAHYYMLMCKEQSYFTILTNTEENIYNETLGEAVLACLESVGKLRAVAHSDSEIELWLAKDEEVMCMHLFAYDVAVVPFGD